MDKQPVSASSSDCWSSSDFWRLPISSFQRSLLKQRKLNQAYEKKDTGTCHGCGHGRFSLLPVVVVSADDFIDNRLQVNNSRLETEQEKTLGGQLDATESLFNEKDQKKLADEKRKQEKQLTDSDGQLFSAIKGKKKTGPEADLFQPENQKLSKFESNVEDNSASLSDFIPALQMLAWSALLFGIAGYISYRIYRKEA